MIPFKWAARTLSPNDKGILALQLVATLIVLALVPGNAFKLAGFLAIWAITFRRISLKEIVCYLGVCLLFSVMDIMAVSQRVFHFSHPDVAGLPLWEFFMWGFYVLHTLRMLNGSSPASRASRVIPLAVVMAVPFMTITDPMWLGVSAAAALATGMFFFHEREDLAYFGYMVLVGALVEYTGVWSGQWSYPGNPAGGVPLWFIPMWGGVGLYSRRLLSPLVYASKERLSRSS